MLAGQQQWTAETIKAEAEQKERLSFYPGGEQDEPAPGPDNCFFVHVSEMADVSAQWIIKNFLEKNCLAELFGSVGTFKTFLAIAIALCIASGKDFFGHKVKDPGPALFIIGEGMSGFKRRMKAWALWHKIDLDSLPILVSRHSASITQAKSVSEIKKAIQNITEKYGPPKLIVIDTLNRNFGPGDENSTQDMTNFIRGCDALRSICGAAVLITHHSGNFEKERSRGSSALNGAIDFRYRLDLNKDETINLVFLKCKEQAIPGPRTLSKRIIDLGITDDDGDAITSCILEETELNNESGQDRTGKGSKQSLMRKILNEMVDEHDKELVEDGAKPEGCVSKSDWIARCKQEGCKRQDLSRNKKFFIIIDGFVYSKAYA